MPVLRERSSNVGMGSAMTYASTWRANYRCRPGIAMPARSHS
jgi:hypothetical protein